MKPHTHHRSTSFPRIDRPAGRALSKASAASLHRVIAALLFVSIVMTASIDRPAHAHPGDKVEPVPQVYLPMVIAEGILHTYDSIPVQPPPIDRPPPEHGDVNLSLRGYVETGLQLGLVDIQGPTDANAPQIAGIFQPDRLPAFVANYQVHEWDWGCSDQGCRGDPITEPEVTMTTMATTPGEEISLPSRAPDIYQGIYRAIVIYATPTQLTLAYLREDTAAKGYVVHLEDLAVAPGLLQLYQELDAAGRGSLPALRNDEPVGTAAGTSIGVVVRDTGRFMDPRSRKDWWAGY